MDKYINTNIIIVTDEKYENKRKYLKYMLSNDYFSYKMFLIEACFFVRKTRMFITKYIIRGE